MNFIRKALSILITLLIIVINIISIIYYTNQFVYNELYNKVKVCFTYKEEVNNQEFEKELYSFSIKNNLCIYQYDFVSDKVLNIYSTNLQAEQSKLSSILSETDTIKIPILNWDITVYEFDRVANVGLGYEFYFSSNDNYILQDFINQFSIFGDINVDYEAKQQLLFLDKSFILIAIFIFIIFIIILYYNIYKYTKKSMLFELWGYSDFKKITIFYKDILLFNIIVVLMLLPMVFVIFGNCVLLMPVLKMYLFINVVLAVIIFLLITIIFYTQNLILNTNVLLYPYAKFKEIKILFIISKFVSTIILFILIVSFINNYIELNIKIDNLSSWDKTENIYKTSVTLKSGDYSNDLTKLEKYENKAVLLYNKLKNNRNAFFIDTNNFNYVDFNKGKPIYLYQLNTSGNQQIYSPYGRCVTINENYIKYNDIEALNEEYDIYEQLQYDNNILNVLVPEKYKNYANEINENYKKYFYFHKVKVPNMYNKAANRPLIEQDINELSINIIYVRNNQTYFSYNSNSGNEKYQIIDPIAIIYNESFDSSYMGSILSSSLCFENSSSGNAYDSIEEFVKSVELPEVKSVTSLYSEVNSNLALYKELLFQQLLGIIITLIISIISYFVIMWSFCMACKYKITVKYLYGYSIYKKYSFIFIINIVSSLFALFVSFVIKDVLIEPIFISFIGLIIDTIILYILDKYINIKNLKQIIEGDI